jgi:phytoene dehydrogenase-like protein
MRGHRRNLAGLSRFHRAYLTSLLQERVIRDLELARFGYRVDAKDPAFFRPFPTAAICSCGRIGPRPGRKSRSSRGTTRRYFPPTKIIWSGSRKWWKGLLLTTPPEFPPQGLGDFIDYLKLAAKMRGLSPKEIVGLVKIFTQSAVEFLDEWFESGEIKVTLATDGVIGANGGPRSPGTAYILLHHVMGSVAAIADCGASCAEAWAGFQTRSRRRRAAAASRFGPTRASSTSRSPTAARAAWCWRAGKRSTPIW